jgi:tyrosyl-tRNA synthetase
MLAKEQIERNVRTYVEQAAKIIDVEKTELRYNSEWLARMNFSDVVRLASKMTVARMLERDYFGDRYKSGTPIGIHEFLYPLMQGWDSVMIEADVEIGGQDQTFNLLVGRDLMRAEGKEPQVCLTLPLLVGLDGVKKMSKSLGNYIGVTEPPDVIYGKAMSIPDALMRNYFELGTQMPEEKIDEFLSAGVHPREAKAALAAEIVRQFWGEKAAADAAKAFDSKFRDDAIPAEMPEHFVSRSELKQGKIWIVKLLADLGMASSNSDARRKVAQGAVTLYRDGRTAEKMDDPDADIDVQDGMVLKVGKKKEYVRIRLR